MAQLSITLGDQGPEPCGLCERPVTAGSGPRLCLTDNHNPVCQECASVHSPSLLAILDLVRVADRVGRIGHHTLVPPLGALLDLARAAENYARAAARRSTRPHVRRPTPSLSAS